jgi:hypothetical protein
LRGFENRMLRRIFGPNGEDGKGGWRKLHDEKLQSLYSSPKIRLIKSRTLSWTDHVAHVRDKKYIKNRNRKIEGERPLGRTRRTRVDNNNNMGLK